MAQVAQDTRRSGTQTKAKSERISLRAKVIAGGAIALSAVGGMVAWKKLQPPPTTSLNNLAAKASLLKEQTDVLNKYEEITGSGQVNDANTSVLAAIEDTNKKMLDGTFRIESLQVISVKKDASISPHFLTISQPEPESDERNDTVNELRRFGLKYDGFGTTKDWVIFAPEETYDSYTVQVKNQATDQKATMRILIKGDQESELSSTLSAMSTKFPADNKSSWLILNHLDVKPTNISMIQSKWSKDYKGCSFYQEQPRALPTDQIQVIGLNGNFTLEKQATHIERSAFNVK